MKNDIKEIREQKLENLYKEVADLYKKLRETRFKISNREIKDTNEKSKTRKKIARIWTIIREKEYDKALENNSK